MTQSAALDSDIISLPKAHLHLHFTGSMSFSTLQDMAHKHGIRLPRSLRENWPPVLASARNQRGWFRFQRLYDAARACVRDADDMRRIVFEAAQADAAEGGRWLELQVDPTSYAPFTGGITPALQIVLQAATEASAETDTQVGIIVAASRIKHPLDARTLARLAAKFAGEGAGTVIGFGLSNDERSGHTQDFAPAFDIARKAGLALMPHGGELLGPAHVADTLTALHPDRLGHGVRSSEDPQVLAAIIAAGIGLEVCPTSNVALGVFSDPASVPLRALMDAGAKIALGADDPLLFGSRLAQQYQDARDIHGCNRKELARLARDSFAISRAPAELKAAAYADISLWERRRPQGTPTKRQ